MAVFLWGLGKSGQLGNGRTENCELPTTLKSVVRPQSGSCLSTNEDSPITTDSIAVGGLFTAWVHNGKVYTTGCGKYGRLGTGSENDVCVPTYVELLPKNIAQVIKCII